MGKRGPKPKKRISEEWSPDLAYAIGLLATDGCMAKKTHLIDLTSKDREQLENFIRCVNLPLFIGSKRSSSGKLYLRVQFKSVVFYNFLLSVGLTPAKSKTLGVLQIPDKYFFHFLRGVFDGDGCAYSYWDPRWKSSFMYYIAFASSSVEFIRWLQRTIERKLKIKGHTITTAKKHQQLRYAKKESLVLFKEMYRNKGCISLSRKKLKVEQMLATIGQRL